jgi:hypothetical protein
VPSLKTRFPWGFLTVQGRLAIEIRRSKKAILEHGLRTRGTAQRRRVPAILGRQAHRLAPEDYDRWLSPLDPDPRELLVPYPAARMTMWPISTMVNKPENDDVSILERVDEPGGIIAK